MVLDMLSTSRNPPETSYPKNMTVSVVHVKSLIAVDIQSTLPEKLQNKQHYPEHLIDHLPMICLTLHVSTTRYPIELLILFKVTQKNHRHN